MTSAAVREASESKLKKAAEENHRKAARVLPLVQEPEDFCAAMQVGAVGFGFFAVDNPLVSGLIARGAGAVGGLWGVALGFVLWVLALMLVVTLCLLAPQRYAEHRPESVIMGLYAPAGLLARLLHPLTWALQKVASLLVRLFGVNPNAQLEEVSEDEIRLMVDAGEESGAIESNEKELIENVFEFNNMTAEDIMVHRTDMVVIWLEDTREEILKTIEDSGLSRFPVCGEDVDDIIGVLSTRDYLMNAQQRQPRPLRQLLRTPHFVPETVKTDVLFRSMQVQKVHMSIVVDEYGGTSGLVTMEDLLEQLVGDIYDEFDAVEEQEISKVSDNLWRIAGSAGLEDVAEALDFALPEEDEDEYETLGGLVFSCLSVIPEDGSHPEVDALGLHIQVEEIADRRVAWALVSRLPQHCKEEE